METDLSIIKLSSKLSSKDIKDALRTLEACVTNGRSVLLEDIGEIIDGVLNPIVAKETFKTDEGRLVIRIGESTVSYDNNFKLFITTKLPNPHYLPEVSIKVNIINFTVTFSGLEEQMLVDVVRNENPQMEKQRDDLIVSLAKDKKMLQDTQDSILDLIANSTGMVLDNLALISALQRSKATSNDIEKRVERSSGVETEINKSRDNYRSVAIRGAILYFVVADLAGIDPMYQYSLAYIKKLFNSSILNTEERVNRLNKLIQNVTENIYRDVCRGLFEAHKIIFSFLISTAIEKHENRITENEWNLFLRASSITSLKRRKDNPLPQIVNKIQWDSLCAIQENLSEFGSLIDHIYENPGVWSFYITDVLKQEIPLSCSFTSFVKLIFIRIFKPEKILHHLYEFVKETLGNSYAESPSDSIEKLYDDSDKRTPIIFVLSQGADPIESLMKLAEDRGFSAKFSIISLGQGQGPRAEESLEKAKISGS